MKLINEDNPFENPPVKTTSNLPHSSVVMLTKGSGDSHHRNQIMSFGDDSSKSIADKTTERESKNTIATMRTGGVGVSSQAAASATLTNHFKSGNHRRMIIGATTGVGTTSGH